MHAWLTYVQNTHADTDRCTSMHTNTREHLHTHTCTHTRTRTHTHTCTHPHTRAHTHTHTHTCTHAHTSAHTHTHTHAHTRIHTCCPLRTQRWTSSCPSPTSMNSPTSISWPSRMSRCGSWSLSCHKHPGRCSSVPYTCRAAMRLTSACLALQPIAVHLNICMRPACPAAHCCAPPNLYAPYSPARTGSGCTSSPCTLSHG